ncbi:MAG: sigma-70 family RNA polymerase sigma factor [Solirubrobacteraceae bacterium]|nr:sigma-70 family RNA polymerase sigma factor [Solirubrobacteraceae bacterium]
MPQPTDERPPTAGVARSADDARARQDRLLFARRDAGDPRAREQLIRRFLPLARSLARRYERSGEPLEDLVQVASLALVKAVDRYEPNRRCAFSSFAVPTITGELKRHFRDRGWAVRPPRELQELSSRVEQATGELGAQLDRSPTASEIAGAVGSSEAHVLEAMQARGARSALSLQGPVAGLGDHAVLQDTLGTEDGGFENAERRALLDRLLLGVTPRTRLVLRLRFEQELTQAEIGALIGLGQMQVSRIARAGLEQLRVVAEHIRCFPETAGAH